MKKTIKLLLPILIVTLLGIFSFVGITTKAQENGNTWPFKLPTLPYSYDALEPYIDTKTMTIHHQKHHGAYVDNLNKALSKYPELQGKTIEELLSNLSSVPEDGREAVMNNGGGHYNHSFFWTIMGKDKPKEPKGKLREDIDKTFGSFENFKKEFKDSALKRFGSGWAWLIKDKSGNLKITSTPNQNSPIMEGIRPILGLDVWEHAYYLNYQNRRADYIDAWWNVVNWEEVERIYDEVTGAKK